MQSFVTRGRGGVPVCSRHASEEAATRARRDPDPADVERAIPLQTVCGIVKMARRTDVRGGSTDPVALLRLGRDDGTAEDWEETRSAAAGQHNERTADDLCGTPLLADLLLSGLDAIVRDRAASDADRL